MAYLQKTLWICISTSASRISIPASLSLCYTPPAASRCTLSDVLLTSSILPIIIADPIINTSRYFFLSRFCMSVGGPLRVGVGGVVMMKSLDLTHRPCSQFRGCFWTDLLLWSSFHLILIVKRQHKKQDSFYGRHINVFFPPTL